MYATVTGKASATYVTVATGLTNQEVSDRVVIIHDATGARISCIPVSIGSPGGLVSSYVVSYPSYTGNLYFFKRPTTETSTTSVATTTTALISQAATTITTITTSQSTTTTTTSQATTTTTTSQATTATTAPMKTLISRAATFKAGSKAWLLFAVACAAFLS
ncbi:unnamed protein product [Polarella glacialis]|uniref:Uncharacterized protein n=1 Tax=Polarella glacialis TaxID=89957 RepID=A0A813G1S3_POLGL|nr:unnamed protein product [Polarella glacialis]